MVGDKNIPRISIVSEFQLLTSNLTFLSRDTDNLCTVACSLEEVSGARTRNNGSLLPTISCDLLEMNWKVL